MIRTPLSQFKRAMKTGETSAGGVILHKLLSTTMEIGTDRLIKFTISTGSIDRDNDTVDVKGWVLDAFQLNPVVLWGHKASQLPVGKCVGIGVEGDALKALVDFVPADVPVAGDFAEAVFRLCREGFLSATSVGFRPLEFELAKERMDDDDWWPPLNFLRQELMEFSIVSIPANPEALIDPTERAAATQIDGAVVQQEIAAAAAAEVQRQAAISAAARMQQRRAQLRAYN
jgi:HK97 family phage prohead protease